MKCVSDLHTMFLDVLTLQTPESQWQHTKPEISCFFFMDLLVFGAIV